MSVFLDGLKQELKEAKTRLEKYKAYADIDGIRQSEVVIHHFESKILSYETALKEIGVWLESQKVLYKHNMDAMATLTLLISDFEEKFKVEK